jgi:hypothetical protein
LINVSIMTSHRCDPLINVSIMTSHRCDLLINVSIMTSHRCDPLINVSIMTSHRCDLLINVSITRSHGCDPLINVSIMRSHGCDPLINVSIMTSHRCDPLINVSIMTSHRNIYLNDTSKGRSLFAVHYFSIFEPQKNSGGIRMERKMRVTVSHTDERFIYARCREREVRVVYRRDGADVQLADLLWEGCRLNLIDVTVDGDGCCVPELTVLEPDYLVDVSSLAECMKPYGAHPLNFIWSRLAPPPKSRHILMGNMANLFLDELVNEDPARPVVCLEAIKKAFRAAPLEFSACEDIHAAFFRDAGEQFCNIRRVIAEEFPEREIDREQGVLEPNFICEDLGLHGRLDFLQLHPAGGKRCVVELKAGKAPFPESNCRLIGTNHQAQTWMYRWMVQRALGTDPVGFDMFVLYSRYAAPGAGLRLSPPPSAEAMREIMHIRNRIVATEHSVSCDESGERTEALLRSLSPAVLITDRTANPVFLERYIVPGIMAFRSVFDRATELETAYFRSLYTFVTREHYLFKTGGGSGGSRGIASLWLSTAEEKLEAGDLLADLSICENMCEAETPFIRLRIPPCPDDFLPNFRQGDIVILYERNRPEDNVTCKQIFKGSIRELSPGEITVGLRFRQRNPSVFPPDSLYAVEHDFPDVSYAAMYRGLYDFLQANRDRKDLLLNLRKPSHDGGARLRGRYLSPEIDGVVLKAKQANDYFLLAGPPGTGKTSIALKSMVEEFLQDPSCRILLLAYTNRAVDEICDALERVEDASYIRIGMEWACREEYRSRLLHRVMEACSSREEVREMLRGCRLFAGTVASVSGRMELFGLLRFQVAIVDEASQIPEPHLLSILSAGDACGGNAVGKFILIGDHKQLPAIVLQDGEASRVDHPGLHRAGLRDRRRSLFERLYGLHKDDAQSPVLGMLCTQGRMHGEIASFPNRAFYRGMLRNAGNPHQTEPLDYYRLRDGENPFQQLIATRRLAFIASEGNGEEKRNFHEARIVKELAGNIYRLYQLNALAFSAGTTLGVITPYRNQIGLIRREIHLLGIPELNGITVDTVERYQGSQRDIILFSVCMNQADQPDFIGATVFEEDGQLIDRKLNVAITRARKQLFIIGNPPLLSASPVYGSLMEHIRSQGGFVRM